MQWLLLKEQLMMVTSFNSACFSSFQLQRMSEVRSNPSVHVSMSCLRGRHRCHISHIHYRSKLIWKIQYSQMSERTSLYFWMVHGEQNTFQLDSWKGRKRQRYLWATVKEEYKKSVVIGKRKWKLNIKICAVLNGNRFLFQCEVHNTIYNRLELTGVLLWQSYSLNFKIERSDDG